MSSAPQSASDLAARQARDRALFLQNNPTRGGLILLRQEAASLRINIPLTGSQRLRDR